MGRRILTGWAHRHTPRRRNRLCGPQVIASCPRSFNTLPDPKHAPYTSAQEPILCKQDERNIISMMVVGPMRKRASHVPSRVGVNSNRSPRLLTQVFSGGQRGLAVAVFALVAATGLLAQEATPIEVTPWKLLVYPTVGGISRSEVSESMESGLIPVGLEIETDGETVILMRLVEELRVAGWTITRHEEFEQLEQEFGEVLAQRFLPMDISSHGGGLSVLWIATDRTIEGWRVHATENSAEAIQGALQRFESQGFSLWGVSVDDERAWYLFVKWEEISQIGALTSFPKDSESIQAGIETARRSGFIPNAIAIDGLTYLVAFSR
jgi:hypothetical protein